MSMGVQLSLACLACLETKPWFMWKAKHFSSVCHYSAVMWGQVAYSLCLNLTNLLTVSHAVLGANLEGLFYLPILPDTASK